MRRAYVLKDAEIAAGEVITTYEPGVWKFKVQFVTPYGGYSSDLMDGVIS